MELGPFAPIYRMREGKGRDWDGIQSSNIRPKTLQEVGAALRKKCSVRCPPHILSKYLPDKCSNKNAPQAGHF